MCDKPLLLVFFMIFKLLIIVFPIVIIFVKKVKEDEKMTKILFVSEILLVLLLVILKVTNNCLVNNSNFGAINRLINYDDENVVLINSGNNANVVQEIITSKIYKTSTGRNVYYFNNNSLPLSDKKISCNGKSLYMKNYGNSLTAFAITLSNAFDKNIDPIQLLNYSTKDKILDCNKGIKVDELINMIETKYNVRIPELSKDEVYNKIVRGTVVIAEVYYNEEASINLTCSKGYIVLYNTDNSGNIKMLNPNDYDHDYICPDQTEGSLDIIEKNSNEKGITVSDLEKISNRFWIIERN